MKGIKLSGLILGLAFLQPCVAKPEVHLNGFLSAGAGVLDADQVRVPQLDMGSIQTRAYLGQAPLYVVQPVRPEIFNYNSKVDFEQDSIATIQGTINFNNQYALTTQVTSKGSKNWEAQTEWAFLSYRLSDNWSMRAGRMRSPLFMLSESLEVGYTYPWVRPPLEVYSMVPSNNYSGADITHRNVLWNQDLEFVFRYGSISSDYAPVGNAPGSTQTLRQRQSWNGAFTYGNERLKGRASYTEVNITLVPLSTVSQLINAYSALHPTAVSDADVTSAKVYFASLGAVLDSGNWLGMAEIVRRDSNLAAIQVQQSYYATLGYRFGSVMPHATYAYMKTLDKDRRHFPGTLGEYINPITSRFDQDQETYILGVRYDFMPGMDFKIQAENIKALHGTSGLFNVNPGKSVNLYSAVIDVVF